MDQMGRSELGPNPITVFFFWNRGRAAVRRLRRAVDRAGFGGRGGAERGKGRPLWPLAGRFGSPLHRLVTRVDDIIIRVDSIIPDESSPLPFPSSSLSSSPSPSLSTDGDGLGDREATRRRLLLGFLIKPFQVLGQIFHGGGAKDEAVLKGGTEVSPPLQQDAAFLYADAASGKPSHRLNCLRSPHPKSRKKFDKIRRRTRHRRKKRLKIFLNLFLFSILKNLFNSKILSANNNNNILNYLRFNVLDYTIYYNYQDKI